MSYIEVKFDRVRGIKFSQGTNMILQESPMMEMSHNERISFGMGYVIWAGLKTNCAINGQRFTKTEDNPNKEKGQPETIEVAATIKDVFEWIEKTPEATLVEIANLYKEVNDALASVKQPDNDEKKSLTDTVTEPSVTESPVES